MLSQKSLVSGSLWEGSLQRPGIITPPSEEAFLGFSAPHPTQGLPKDADFAGHLSPAKCIYGGWCGDGGGEEWEGEGGGNQRRTGK